MKHLIIFFFLFLTALVSSHAQITFEKWYNFGATENGFSVEQTFDGGYIVSGRHGISFITSELILHKVDSLGNTQWTKFIKNGPYEHEGWDVKQTADSGYIITGMMDDIPGMSANIYLVKTDKNGDTLWTRNYGSVNYDQGWSVQPTFDGGYIVATQKDTVAWLLKTDNNGDTLWTKTYIPQTGIQSQIFCVKQLNDSGFVLAGTVALMPSVFAVYLIKTNKNGDTLWTKTYPGIGWQNGQYVDTTSDGGYIVAGYKAVNVSDNSVYLLTELYSNWYLDVFVSFYSEMIKNLV